MEADGTDDADGTCEQLQGLLAPVFEVLQHLEVPPESHMRVVQLGLEIKEALVTVTHYANSHKDNPLCRAGQGENAEKAFEHAKSAIQQRGELSEFFAPALNGEFMQACRLLDEGQKAHILRFLAAMISMHGRYEQLSSFIHKNMKASIESTNDEIDKVLSFFKCHTQSVAVTTYDFLFPQRHVAGFIAEELERMVRLRSATAPADLGGQTFRDKYAGVRPWGPASKEDFRVKMQNDVNKKVAQLMWIKVRKNLPTLLDDVLGYNAESKKQAMKDQHRLVVAAGISEKVRNDEVVLHETSKRCLFADTMIEQMHDFMREHVADVAKRAYYHTHNQNEYQQLVRDSEQEVERKIKRMRMEAGAEVARVMRDGM
tara:strand:- start:542 stop:1657 length:1116 start_codon:yes stop_codon:yes gene_type:complete